MFTLVCHGGFAQKRIKSFKQLFLKVKQKKIQNIKEKLTGKLKERMSKTKVMAANTCRRF